jgi:hypothetical protein
VGSRGMRNCKARSGLCAGQAVSQAHARIRGAINRGQASSTLDKNRMREFRTYGSVRGVPSNGHPYRDPRPVAASAVHEKRTVGYSAFCQEDFFYSLVTPTELLDPSRR